MKPFLLICFALALFPACRKKDNNPCQSSASLYSLSRFPVGVAINQAEFNNNPVARSIAQNEFNSFTAENIFKAEYLHPEENTFNWTDADSLATFCLANKKRLHGHTLIWHLQLPAWITSFNGDAAAWEQVFKTHIQTIVRHFKGRVAAWDVVNEAFNEDGTLRNSIWRQKLGNTYIEKALQYAHEADPDALLFYNDYNLESNPAKRNSVIQYFGNLRNRGVKIDGIGLQMHVSIAYPEATQIAEAFQQVSAAGFRVHLSELDISINPSGGNIRPTQELFEQQAGVLGKIIQHYKQVPLSLQYGVTIWGISDKDSWIRTYFNRQDYPLLYDENYIAKPAFCRLKESL